MGTLGKIAYREQRAQGLCKLCREPAESGCKRCGDPLCGPHLPSDDRRCDDCENIWLEKAARRELGRWGVASTSLVSVAKWAARFGGLGILVGIVLSFFPASGLLIALWLPVAILLLGFPIAAAAIGALPLARAAERVAARLAEDRKRFLLESEAEHAAKLLRVPSASE